MRHEIIRRSTSRFFRVTLFLYLYHQCRQQVTIYSSQSPLLLWNTHGVVLELESRRPDSPESSEPSSKRAKVATPFDDLEISDDSILDSVTDRSECPRCKKSVKYFCYRCFDVVGMERSQIPTVNLPVRLNVYVLANMEQVVYVFIISMLIGSSMKKNSMVNPQLSMPRWLPKMMSTFILGERFLILNNQKDHYCCSLVL